MSTPETLCLLVGSPRSGTTLATRLIMELDGVAGPPLETHFFDLVVPWLYGQGNPRLDPSVAEILLKEYSRSYRLDAVQLDVLSIVDQYSRTGRASLPELFRCVVHSLSPRRAPVLLEKTPEHLWYWPLLANCDVRFVCLVRDPRAVVEATLRRGWAADATDAACQWREEQRELGRLRRALGSRVWLVRYEEVVSDPNAFRAAARTFLGLARSESSEPRLVSAPELFPPREADLKMASLGPIDQSKVSVWRERLDDATVGVVEAYCRRDMHRNGYRCQTDRPLVAPLDRWRGSRPVRASAAGVRLTIRAVDVPTWRTLSAVTGIELGFRDRVSRTLFEPAYVKNTLTGRALGLLRGGRAALTRSREATAATTTMRVAVISRFPMSERHDAADGFSSRNRFLLDVLAARHDVMIVYIGTDDEFVTEACRTTRGDVEVAALSFTPSSVQSRRGRIAAATRLLVSGGRRPAPWEESLISLLQGWQPDLVLGFLREHWQLARVPASVYPTALFVEEDFYRLPGWMTKSTPWGRALERFEHTAAAYSVRGSTTRVVISPAESRWARRRFLGCNVHVVPHWIDVDYWAERVPPAPEVSERDVFVLNHMGQARNAIGLRDIADALARRCGEGAPRLLVATSEAPHEALRDAHPGVVQFLGYVEDPRPYYRAKVALVPSFEVTGTKTTILQAWAAGCPVVTTTSAAASVGATSGAEVLAGADPDEVAALLVRVLRDDVLANDLVENGRKRLMQAYSSAAARDAFEDVLTATVRRSRRNG